MYVDFSSNFNTIDHDKLLIIMYDLVFPVTCIEAVKNLYQYAETSFLLPCGEAGPVENECGTIQGDSLSPLLFLIFVEPHVRWLHSGGRGYRLQALQSDSLKVSSLTYTDDLCAITNRSHDLRLQAQKIEGFETWGGLKVNNNECAATGMLYAASRTKANGNVCTTRWCNALRRDSSRLKSHRISPVLGPWQALLLP